jgi:hypothetical protein
VTTEDEGRKLRDQKIISTIGFSLRINILEGSDVPILCVHLYVDNVVARLGLNQEKALPAQGKKSSVGSRKMQRK